MGFCVVFPLALSEQVGYWAILYSSLLVMIFTKVFELGLELLNPFEGQPSDIPVSSIIRTIEINLLEQMGKKNIPHPLDPVDGRYLM